LGEIFPVRASVWPCYVPAFSEIRLHRREEEHVVEIIVSTLQTEIFDTVKFGATFETLAPKTFESLSTADRFQREIGNWLHHFPTKDQNLFLLLCKVNYKMKRFYCLVHLRALSMVARQEGIDSHFMAFAFRCV
jgi:hypothetical protein